MRCQQNDQIVLSVAVVIVLLLLLLVLIDNCCNNYLKLFVMPLYITSLSLPPSSLSILHKMHIKYNNFFFLLYCVDSSLGTILYAACVSCVNVVIVAFIEEKNIY